MSDRECENYLALLKRLLRLSDKQQDEIAGELRAHLEDRLDELRSRGLSREEAVRLALEEFGGAAGLAGEFVGLSRKRRRRWIMRCMSYSVAATVVVAAGLAIFWPGRNAAPGVAQVSAQGAVPSSPPPATQVPVALASADVADAKVAHALNRRMNLDYDDVPLKDVATHLTEETGVTFYVKAKKLEEASISPDTPIHFHFKDIRLSTFLELMLGELDLTFVERDGLVLITTPEDAESRLDIRVYDCRDLIAMPTPELDRKAATEPPKSALQGPDALPPELRLDNAKSSSPIALGGISGSSAAQRAADGPKTAYEERTDDLIAIITGTVDPQTWDDVGGPGAIDAYNGLIVVAQTADMHRKVEQVFDMLRRAAGLEAAKGGKVVR